SRHPGVALRFERADFLSKAAPEGKFELIAANPPYVRRQRLGGARARALSKRFSLRGRIDLSHAFVLALAEALAPEGVLGLIVSNRLLSTKAGAPIRAALPERVRIRALWDLGDTALFDAAVLPAMIVATGRESPLEPGQRSALSEPSAAAVSLYRSEAPATARAEDPIEALAHRGTVEVSDGRRFQIRRGLLEQGAPGEVWRLSSREDRRWLEALERATDSTFGALGPIRVGVKSCADPVFVREDWSGCPGGEPELLRPILTHHDAARFRAAPPSRRILYPHQRLDGRIAPIHLEAHPRAAAYLAAHRVRLERRAYLHRAGRRWYELWVPHDPDGWAAPKLVFRDISARPTFWMDFSGAVVNGDCYWLSLAPGVPLERLWLALAVANSSFIEAFYDRRFPNKLYGGRRRYITQYVRHFPLPDPERACARRAAGLARDLFEARSAATRPSRREADALDALVWEMFGLAPGMPPAAGSGAARELAGGLDA
ncbi:MAG: Eco57I restriction-modification methylase domain-containing protein, partial [Myxococcales bacterium]|nr:Eco57I restriction-modification methylase domain-containing protein [Myxococcales bacterium]